MPEEEDEGYTDEEPERRARIGPSYHRGSAPGDPGYLPITFMMGGLFVFIGVLFIIPFVQKPQDPAMDIFGVLGVLAIIAGLMGPVLAFKADKNVKDARAARIAKRDHAEAEALGFSGEPRARPIDEDEDDSAWIPGKTRPPQGSEPEQKEETDDKEDIIE